MKTIITTSLFFFITFSSCITSLQPLVTSDKVITEKRIEGKWICEHSAMGKGQEFTIEPVPDSLINKALGSTEQHPNRKYDSIVISKSYHISYKKDSNNSYMSASLIQLGNKLYMDLTPIGSGFGITVDEIYRHSTEIASHPTEGANLPTYTIAKLQFNNSNTLELLFLDGDFIKKQVVAGKVRIKHEFNKLYDMFLITASSRELQQFLIKYGNDERLYNKANKVILKRKA
jgi:hypothetical protein